MPEAVGNTGDSVKEIDEYEERGREGEGDALLPILTLCRNIKDLKISFAFPFFPYLVIFRTIFINGLIHPVSHFSHILIFHYFPFIQIFVFSSTPPVSRAYCIISLLHLYILPPIGFLCTYSTLLEYADSENLTPHLDTVYYSVLIIKGNNGRQK